MHCRLAISVLALSASIVGAAPLHSSQTRDHSTISIAVAQATSVDQQVAAVMQQHEEIQLPAAVPEVANDVVAQPTISSAVLSKVAHLWAASTSSDDATESPKPRRRSIRRRHP